MPTSFTSVANGDPILPAQLNQFIAPVNALENSVAALSSPSLDQISDVAISSPSTGQTVRYNGSLWVNAALSAADVGAAASSHGHAAGDITSGVLATARLGSGTADNTTFLRGDGSWTTPPGGAGNLDGLSDVVISSPSTGQTIRYNGTNFVNAALTAADVGAAASSHNHAASEITSGVMATARLGTGTANNTTFLRGDGSWNQPSLDQLSDVVVSTPSTGQTIRYNGTNFVNAALTAADVGAAASSHGHPAGDITSGVMATARLGTGTANNTTFLRGDGTWATAGGTPSLSDITAGTLGTSVPLRFSTSNTTGTSNAQPELFITTSALVTNVPTGWSFLWRIGGANYGQIGTTGFIFGTDQTLSNSSISLLRTTQSLTVNASAGRHVRINAGTGTTVPTGAAWTTIGSFTGVSQGLFYAFVSGMGWLEMWFDGSTLSKLNGTSTLIVAGSAGPTEVAFRVNAGNLQASNGTGADVTAFTPGAWTR